LKGKEILTAEAIEEKDQRTRRVRHSGPQRAAWLPTTSAPPGWRRCRGRPRAGACAPWNSAPPGLAAPPRSDPYRGAGTKDIDVPRCGDAAGEGLLLGTSGGGAHALAAIRFNPMEEVLEEPPAAIGRRTRGNGGAKAHRAATIKGSKR